MSNAKYAARRFALDGASITDHYAETPEQVWIEVNDSGSRWFFYPLAVVVRNGSNAKRGRIVAAPKEIAHYRGRTCGTLSRAIERWSETAAPTSDLQDLLATL